MLLFWDTIDGREFAMLAGKLVSLQEELDSLYNVDYNNRRSDDGGTDTAVFTVEWEQQTVQISTV